MEIQPFTFKDLPGIPFIQPPDWPDISKYFEFYVAHPDFCFPVKLVIDNKMIGTGAIIQNRRSCWLAHIIMIPEHRGRGLGYLITKELIQMAEKSGCETISLIATSLGRPVYEKLGFAEEEYYQLLTGPKINPKKQSTSVTGLNSPEEIYELDKEISGEDRWEMLNASYDHGKLYLNGNGAVEGYYLPQMGEGLVYATTFEAAKALYTLRFQQQENRTGLPESNETAINYLLHNGFNLKDRIVRMYLGKQLTRKPPMVYARAGGYYG